MATTISDFGPLNKLVTPEFDKKIKFMDADDELIHIAEYIKTKTEHNAYIKPERIKFIYSRKAKKEAGRFTIGEVILRNDIEKMVNDKYDYIVSVYHPVWKDLDMEHKIIQLDKILCGIDVTDEEKLAKKQKDSREHIPNLRFFGIEKVMRSSETVHIAMSDAVERQKGEDKKIKNGEMVDANILNDEELKENE